jgi:hypothetical protein
MITTQLALKATVEWGPRMGVPKPSRMISMAGNAQSLWKKNLTGYVNYKSENFMYIKSR